VAAARPAEGSIGAGATNGRGAAASAAATGRTTAAVAAGSGRGAGATEERRPAVPGAHGTFLIAELGGEAGARIRALQERFDPKFLRETPPHVTIAGSSGLGVIPPDVPRARVLELLAPVGAETEPLVLPFGAPERFPGTNIVVLPLDPHGPIRALHDRIARSGLPFAAAKFTFTPHATLSFYPTLAPAALRELLAARVREPAVIDRLVVSHTRAPQPPVRWGEVVFAGGAPAPAATPIG
jgi:2'-5' RNA ligase